MTSEWPFRYLVVECTTMSKPSSRGRCTQGEAKVLSHTEMMPRLRAIAATASRWTSLSSGLVGLSTHSMRVPGLIAFSKFPGSERSVNVAWIFAERLRTRSRMR